MSYEDKVIKALSLAENVDDVNYIRARIQSTESINRRTQLGRDLTQKLLDLCQKRIDELVDSGVIPF